MASDSSEPSRRKYRRSSSPVDAEERSKRHKRRHHRRHRHHRSMKDKDETTINIAEEKIMEGEGIPETDVVETKLENKGDGGEVFIPNGSGFAAVDYDMEEGEIVDDGLTGGNFDKLKNLDSDAESGEIKPNSYDDDSNMVLNDEIVETVDRKFSKLEKDTADGKKTQRKSLSPERRSRLVSGPNSHDKSLKESSHGKLSKSPDRSRGRSRSRSILQEGSSPHKTEDPYNLERKHKNNSEDERMIGRERNHRHSSRDYFRDTERERSSSRYSERTDRDQVRETRERYRESSRDRDRERDILRERGKERDKESARLQDRDRSVSERDRGMLKERGRDSYRSRDRDRDRDNASDRFSRRQKYGNDHANGDRERDNDSGHRRNPENQQRDRSKRTDVENLSSKSDPKERGDENPERDDEGQEDYQERISMQLAEQEEDVVERIKEESRRRKQAILEKYKNKQKNEMQSQDIFKEKVGQFSEQLPGVESNVEKTISCVESENGYVAESPFTIGKSPSQNGLPTPEAPTGTGGLGEGTPKSERSDDMFCDDIFGESPAGARKTGKEGVAAVEKSGVNDNWDDAEGYYGYRFGEILDGRYEIIAAHGKGVFSTVVRAKDLKATPRQSEEVAIKIIRNNETMYKAGMDELVILNKLVGADPENKRHCVRYLSNFKYRNHLCLVFESLHMNLREVLKKFGRNIGLKLTAVRTYAKQLFIALKHLKSCGVLHCDIKPDNMLVNEAKNVLKLCDFGNAMFSGRNEITPYLVSRFYRAPEIILGLPYDHPMDIWSVGCCLFELYTGKVLFPGPTNNDMLRLHMELKGPSPKKMLRKGVFTDQYFDQDLNFLATEEDPVTKKIIRRLTVNIKPKDFGSLILGSPGEDPKMASNFKDLMEKIFVLDPDKRMTVSQALSHPFITGK